MIWKYVIIAAVVAGIIFGIYSWRQSDIEHWKSVGRTELRNEIDLATQKAEEETKVKQKEIRQQSSKVKDEIKRNAVGDRAVSPVIRDQLKRMRKRQD